MIEYPDLEIRNEDQIVAEAVSRTSGGLTTEIVEAQIRERQEILKQISAGLSAPVCPELTNANPSAPHTVLLETMGWLLAQQSYKFNRVPEQNVIAFANLFGISRRVATASQTILRFTINPPLNTNVNIPIGTVVTDADGKYAFETIEELTISYGTTTGEVQARRIETGHILLAPNILTEMEDVIAYVESVTNPNAVDSGTELESVESALERMRQYQQRGERIVTIEDLENAILIDALLGNGIVKAFPYLAGDLTDEEFTGEEIQIGHTTCVVANGDGSNLDDTKKAQISDLLQQVVGNQYIYLANPVFVQFNIEAQILLENNVQQSVVLKAVQQNLRNFYKIQEGNFGRTVFRSDIIAIIEGTPGVSRVVSQEEGNILINPLVDIPIKTWRLPKLVNVNISSV